MQEKDRSAITRRRGWGRVRLASAGLALAVIGLGAGLAATALPAYADVTSGYYTIGTPSSPVGGVVATPGTATVDASTNFEVTFTTAAGLSGANLNAIGVAPSEDLMSFPTNVNLVGGSCIQSGTSGAGGTPVPSTSQLIIELESTCTINAGSQVEVFFTANAPSTLGSFYFTVTTSTSSMPATSNSITVSLAGPALSAASLAFGANTNYTISNLPVAGLSADQTTLTLIAGLTAGTELITFYSGAAGYSVYYTPSGGTATADTVTAATATGSTVILTLASSLATGDTLDITATGTNPAYSAATQSNDITVIPGNGSPEATSSVTFGNSVSDVIVSPASSVAGATTNYSVSFKATDAVNVGGEIMLSEVAGPTNFTDVSGVEVSDTTQAWNIFPTGSGLTSGSADVFLTNPIYVGDSITVLLVNVVNPPAGTVSDFEVSTTGDPVPVHAVPYVIGTSASPGVVVTVSPSTTGALATYTIANLHASAAMAGGTSTLELEAPTGTVFAATPGDIGIVDSTTPTGTGTVTAALTGGGTDNVTFTVPNNISAGDVLTVTVSDVINPATSSSTDTITVVGNVTGPPALATTTTVPPTTTTSPAPVVSEVTKSATVGPNDKPGLRLECKVSRCKGYITLTDVSTKVGSISYGFNAGKSHTYPVPLNSQGIELLKGAKDHTIKVTATVSVNGGKTVKERVTLVG